MQARLESLGDSSCYLSGVVDHMHVKFYEEPNTWVEVVFDGAGKFGC